MLEFLAPHFEITVYYYNPNIEPYEEFKKRAEELIRFCEIFIEGKKFKVITAEYENKVFHEMAASKRNEPEGGSRCFDCYFMRMEKAIKYAKDGSYDYFGTTLTISPHKNANFINLIGEDLSKKYEINYLYADFKKNNGYKRSIEISKEYNLYRQDYCGCYFSKPKQKKENN